MKYHVIPHTHWDREWYLPLAVFQARLVPVIDTALDLLERDATQRVTLDGQTVLVEDYLTLKPESRDRVQQQVARGALEIGPWYVLGDELVPAGESLIRNLLEGTRDAASLGARSEVLYSPDAFGHPGVLPALAREFGLRTGVTWRGMGNPAGADRDVYRWIAPDDSELIVYHLPPDGYTVGVALSHDPAAWRALAREAGTRATTEAVVFVGADHHPIPDLTALSDAHPDIRISTLSEFMREVRDTRAPEVRGELRRTGHTWVLQGVHGTRPRMKRLHGIAELSLSRIADPLAALARTAGVADLRPALRHAWRLLLQSQFHDTIGGCSVDAVAVTQMARLHDVIRLARHAGERGFDTLVGHDADAADTNPPNGGETLALWNPAARARGGVITAELAFFRRDVIVGPPSGRVAREGPGFQPFTLMDADVPVPLQVLAVRPGMDRVDGARHSPDQDEVDRVFVAFHPSPLPGLGTRMLGVRRGESPAPPAGLAASRGKLANRLVQVQVSPTGVVELTDLASGERYPALASLEDEIDGGDTYTFSHGSGRAIRGGRPLSQTVLASGPLLGAVETRWELAAATGGTIAVRQVLVLNADSPLVRIRLDIVNDAVDHRLRARFPVDAGDEAVAGAAFGFERRAPVDPDTRPGLIERPVLTAPAHRYVAAGEGRRGLAIFAPGFFEYEWTHDKELLVTLVRAVGELSRPDLPERPGHAGWPEPVPLAQEDGLHRIDLVIAPWNGAGVEHADAMERTWEDAFLPLQARGYRQFAGGTAAGGFTLQGEGLVFSTLKAGEGDAMILRCWNAREEPVSGRWISAVDLKRAARLRADETEVEELPIQDGRTIPFIAGPRAIVTIGASKR